jgi:hypothetical protein
MEGPPPCHGKGGAGWLLLSLFSSFLSQSPALSLPQTLAAAARFYSHPLPVGHPYPSRFGRVLRMKLCQLRQSAPELLVEDDGQKKTRGQIAPPLRLMPVDPRFWAADMTSCLSLLYLCLSPVSHPLSLSSRGGLSGGGGVVAGGAVQWEEQVVILRPA